MVSPAGQVRADPVHRGKNNLILIIVNLSKNIKRRGLTVLKMHFVQKHNNYILRNKKHNFLWFLTEKLNFSYSLKSLKCKDHVLIQINHFEA